MVLFPYKPAHSPYCGITGFRLFPRKESIQADEVGNKEFMGIVVSKKQIDYNALNTAINAITNVSFNNGANGSMNFKSITDPKSIVACVVEIDKQ
jgi:hypothetical protein